MPRANPLQSSRKRSIFHNLPASLLGIERNVRIRLADPFRKSETDFPSLSESQLALPKICFQPYEENRAVMVQICRVKRGGSDLTFAWRLYAFARQEDWRSETGISRKDAKTQRFLLPSLVSILDHNQPDRLPFCIRLRRSPYDAMMAPSKSRDAGEFINSGFRHPYRLDISAVRQKEGCHEANFPFTLHQDFSAAPSVALYLSPGSLESVNGTSMLMRLAKP
jgi:hypothetical protein